MKVETKDEKFRLTFSNLRLSWPPSYNSTFGYQKAYEGPVHQKSDFEVIKPKLLGIGDELSAYCKGSKAKDTW
jgi:hypothetical protein